MSGYTPDRARWQRLTELFDRAIDLDADSRRALLESVATSNPELHAELQGMLAADATSGRLNTAGGEAVRVRMGHELCDQQSGNDLIGQRIGAYRIERLLARGGMGRVFLASREEGEFEQRVALKLLRPELIDDLARRRFLEERRVLARLSHPNIARLYDGGLGPDGEPWYAMEYIDGAALTHWCDARRLPVAARAELFGKVCDAVDFAHRHLVIHRDLKPGNILVNVEGEPKLLDFGIAKLLAEGSSETRSETRLMTPEYAAPEQLRGEAVSTASDVYALGAVLFELLTGQRAFPDPLGNREPPSTSRACKVSGEEAESLAAARATTPKQLRARLHGDLDRIIRTALDPDPARRYRSASAVAEDLRRHLAGRPISVRNDRRYRLRKFAGRHKLGIAASVLAVLAVAGAFAFALLQMQRARDEAATSGAVRDFMVAVFASADPDRNPGKPATARELLDAGATRLDRQTGVNPKIKAALSQALSSSYVGVGDYNKAQQLAARALQSIAQSYGEYSTQVLNARLLYAEQLHRAGLEHQSQQQARQVIAALHEDTGVNAVRAHLVLADSSFALSQLREAESEAKRVLALGQRVSGNTATLQAEAWNDLAQIDLSQNLFDNAGNALRHSVDLFARGAGENADVTLDARTNLTFVLLHTGHVDEALRMYEQMIASQRQALGPHHPRLLDSMTAYAFVLWEAGRYPQARTAAAEAKRALDAAPEITATQRIEFSIPIAGIELTRGNFAGAEKLLDDSGRGIDPNDAKSQRSLFGAHWMLATIDGYRAAPDAVTNIEALRAHSTAMHRAVFPRELLDVPRAWNALGKSQRALQAVQEILPKLPDSPKQLRDHGYAQIEEGIALAGLNRNNEAQRVFENLMTRLGNDPKYAQQSMHARLWRGWMRVREGSPAAGSKDIEAALDWCTRQLGADSFYTGEALLAHAEALAGTGQHARALAEQSHARKVLAAQVFPNHVLLRRAGQPLPPAPGRPAPRPPVRDNA